MQHGRKGWKRAAESTASWRRRCRCAAARWSDTARSFPPPSGLPGTLRCLPCTLPCSCGPPADHPMRALPPAQHLETRENLPPLWTSRLQHHFRCRSLLICVACRQVAGGCPMVSLRSWRASVMSAGTHRSPKLTVAAEGLEDFIFGQLCTAHFCLCKCLRGAPLRSAALSGRARLMYCLHSARGAGKPSVCRHNAGCITSFMHRHQINIASSMVNGDHPAEAHEPGHMRNGWVCAELTVQHQHTCCSGPAPADLEGAQVPLPMEERYQHWRRW